LGGVGYVSIGTADQFGVADALGAIDDTLAGNVGGAVYGVAVVVVKPLKAVDKVADLAKDAKKAEMKAEAMLSKEEKAVKNATGKGNNITVKTQQEAERILEKARPNIPWSETYGPKTKVGKEVHPVDGSGNALGFDAELPHIKWRDWSGGKASDVEGHIYFESVNGSF